MRMQRLRAISSSVLRASQSLLANPGSIAPQGSTQARFQDLSADRNFFLECYRRMANVKTAEGYSDSGHEDVYGEDDSTKDLPVTPWGRFIAK